MQKGNQQPGPDFLLIGMPKTGTSWIHWNLAQHPDIFLPPVKEIRYFFEKAYLPPKSRISIILSKENHYKKWRFYLKTRPRKYASMIYNGKVGELIKHSIPWDVRFLFGCHTDRWYTNLFPKDKGRISGEISPMYATLPENWVAHVQYLYPQLKVVLILRNPIERIWSNIKMSLGIHKGRSLDEITNEEFYRYLDYSIHSKTSQLDAYRLWAQYFPSNQFYVDFYDHLCEQPLSFLKQICQFLDIDFHKAHLDESEFFTKRMGDWGQGDIPNEYKQYLAHHFHYEMHEIASIFGNYAQNWLEELPHKAD